MNVRVYPVSAFDEVAQTLRYGLKALAATGCVLPDREIWLGPHLLPWDTQPDDRVILYNLEQHDSPLLNNSVLDLFRKFEVWDYSSSNVAWLKERGVRAKHVLIGYVPELRRIEKVEPDIDVLFYGLVNTRRRRILDDLKDTGLNVHEVVNCYGAKRDQLIARSKIVLNTHFYETAVFEMVRCSYLFANEVCVVSEESVDVPESLSGAVCFARHEHIVYVCNHLVRNPDRIQYWATRAYDAFRSCDETAILREALWTGC